MKKKTYKRKANNPVVVNFCEPVAGFDMMPESWQNLNPKTTVTNEDVTTSSNGIGWVNAISGALGSLIDKFANIAVPIWGGDKSTTISDDKNNLTTFVVVGAVVIVAIVLIMNYMKK